ncbi:ATP-binding cassette domain-containing protein [Serinicoccus sp. CUA-874]|uniref:ATP-binding cassette domain-containing protein n=1 Tax=Serinicoccus sp. CUA-874 TaxID=1517939 RepID=UPI002AA2A391|nr:ATP-binding cassette domain-containing protein [Serinicoccus sp. CUA-874]
MTGPSGRGKSTLLYVLGLMLTPTSGRVLLGGEAVSAAPDAVRARVRAHRIGFVFQDAALDPTRTVLDSVIEPALYAGWRLGDARAAGRGCSSRWGSRRGRVTGRERSAVGRRNGSRCAVPW